MSPPNTRRSTALLFSLGVSGPIKLRRIDGGRKIAGVLEPMQAVIVEIPSDPNELPTPATHAHRRAAD